MYASRRREPSADRGLIRTAIEEVLNRWPDWEVDYSSAAKAETASVRGWARLPVTTC